LSERERWYLSACLEPSTQRMIASTHAMHTSEMTQPRESPLPPPPAPLGGVAVDVMASGRRWSCCIVVGATAVTCCPSAELSDDASAVPKNSIAPASAVAEAVALTAAVSAEPDGVDGSVVG